jgi:hypothetical protein
MKHYKLATLRLIAVVYAGSISPVAQSQQTVGSRSMAPTSRSEMNSGAPVMPKSIRHSRNQVLRGSFPNIKGGMEKDLGMTSAAMESEAPKSGALDGWLIVLAAFGLIVLQLRHKHRSLPQRRITPFS